jgi:hypothetical protein
VIDISSSKHQKLTFERIDTSFNTPKIHKERWYD